MGVIKGFLLAIALLVIISLVVVYAGLVDVAANQAHSSATRWLLGTAMERAVQRRASFVVVPERLPPPERGAVEYAAMCAVCHGAPAGADSSLAKGLMPEPPRLAAAAAQWKDAELYWIIKNGVKMTGMPAWGGSHSDEELWALVSFLRLLPRLSPEAYAAMVQSGSPGEGHLHH